MIQLRPYQREAVDAVYGYLREHDDNPCAVLPTAAGKTPVLATICRDAVAARFLLTIPPRRAKQWTDHKVSQTTEQSLADVFTTLWGLAPMNADGEPAKPLDLPLVDEARPVWAEFVNAHGQETADVSGPLAAAFSKLEGYAARLALVLSLARWAENPGMLGIGPATVDLDSIRAGIEIVEWAKSETRRIYVMLSEDDQDRERREVLELVERHGGSITVREVQRAMHHSTTEVGRDAACGNGTDAAHRYPADHEPLHGPDAAERGRDSRRTAEYCRTAPEGIRESNGSR
jgi:hypothetical protein